MEAAQRRYDIDWLRILAVLLLIPFHSALIFVMDPNSIMYVKDSVNSPFLDGMASVIHQFHMPLLFVLSGMASFMALGYRSAGKYVAERFSKLLIPAAFGIVTLIPFTTYIARLSRGDFISFFSHYAGFFRFDGKDLSGYYGTLTPAHLWFLIFLFLFSLIGLPLFLSLRKPIQAGKLEFLTKPFALLLLGLPLALAASADILGDKNPIVYFLFFFYGFVLAGMEGSQKAIDRDWKFYLPLAILFECLRHILPDYPEGTLLWALWGIMVCTNRFIMVLALLGIGHRFLNKGGKALQYLSEAAFPVYLLHLPVTTLIGYYVIRMQAPVAVKYLVIISVATCATFLLYELLRRIRIMRFLLGMKAVKRAASNKAINTQEV